MSDPATGPGQSVLTSGARSDSICVTRADLRNPAESDALVQLLDAYARDPIGEGQGLCPSTRRRLVPALRAFPGALVLLAWQAQCPVGLAVCFPSFSTFRAAPVLNVHDLAVIPSARRLGVGSRLLAVIEEEAHARGCCKVTLEVRNDNAPARSLYQRAGYGAGLSPGASVQYLFLEKRLDAERRE